MKNFLTSAVSGMSDTRLTVTSVIAAAGGFVAGFLGGCDSLLMTLVTLIVLDYVTGVINAIYNKRLSSEVGFKGIAKKMLILIIVGLSVSLNAIMPEGVPLREITILFFVANEGFSILENASGIIPLPKKLSSVLLQLKQKSEDKSDQAVDSADSVDVKASDSEPADAAAQQDPEAGIQKED